MKLFYTNSVNPLRLVYHLKNIKRADPYAFRSCCLILILKHISIKFINSIFLCYNSYNIKTLRNSVEFKEDFLMSYKTVNPYTNEVVKEYPDATNQ